MGNVSGNITAGDSEQAVLNATLLAIAVMGLALAFVRMSWRRFREIDGTPMTLLGKQVVLSTVVVMMIAFIFAVSVARPPDPDRPFDASYLALMAFAMTGWAGIFGIWFYRYVFRRIRQYFRRGKVTESDSISIQDLEKKAPSLVAWCGCCGILIGGVACALLALLWLGGGAVGLRFSGSTIEWGAWFSWNGVLLFAIGVLFFGLGYTMDMVDMWPFVKVKKNKENEQSK